MARLKIDASPTVTLTRARYNQLLEIEAYADALDAAGVDNWEGYGEAMAELHGHEEDEDAE